MTDKLEQFLELRDEPLIVESAPGKAKAPQSQFGRTTLHVACMRDDHASATKMVELVLRKPQAVNEQDTLGRTALHYASENGHTDVLTLLFTAGADVSLKDDDGKTALDLATTSEARETLEGFERIHFKRQHPFAVAEQALQSADPTAIHQADEAGRTPLFQAIANTTLLRQLLDRGARVGVQDKFGQTPLHLAVQADQVESIQLLLERGASTDIKDFWGLTPAGYVTSKKKEARRLLGLSPQKRRFT